jgi:lipopolysaccharide transport system ATP-binding protein
MTTVIRVENLSKKYVINHKSPRSYSTFGEALTHGVRRSIKKIIHPLSSGLKGENDTQEEFWALKDVSFEINQGDRVGIIGRNGAGKSTLLKILSRITEHTKGSVSMRGRVASLLEVGTGFHPELSGRENIFLNGAILGMSNVEIKQKFDEIVAFAEVEKFLDTPVKRYSSGMYVRLAFAVAAHLEPEILIVDEVLAVGDVQFQKKCLGKMEDVARDGKTILLVSHNLPTILSLSKKVLLLNAGKVVEYGDPYQVVTTFQDGFHRSGFGQSDLSNAERYGNGEAIFRAITMTPLDRTGARIPAPVTGCDLLFELDLEAYRDLRDITVALTIYDELGARLVDVNTLIKGDAVHLTGDRKTKVSFLLHNVLLKPDAYTVGLWMGTLNQFDIDGVRYATLFRMDARHEDILYTSPFPGIYVCEYDYEILNK